MYGFPTQTVQDTVDALEYVRQLFEHGCLHSGFFHRFACTVHSPVGREPEAYGVRLQPLPEGRFAKNDVAFIDPTGTDHDASARASRRASTTSCMASGWSRTCGGGSRSRCRGRRCTGIALGALAHL